MRLPTRRPLLLAALVTFGVVAVADQLLGVSVTYLDQPRTEAEVEEARSLRDPRDPVAELYGVPVPGRAERRLLLDRSRLITPREDPGLRLLPLAERGRGDMPAARLWWVGGAVVLVLVLLGLTRPARPGQGPRGG